MKKTLTILLTVFFTVLILITCKKKPEVETYTLSIYNENITVTTTSATITADFSFPTTIYDIKVVLSDNSGMSNATIKPTTISGNQISVTFDNLTMATNYYYCYRYSNNVNIVDTEVKHFRTQDASQPTVVTGEVTDITKTTAKALGNVTNDGEATVTERGICWSENHNPTIEGSHANNGTGTGEYDVTITGLTAGTTYYVRAYAKNSAGTSYGSEVSFTTLPNDNAPTVTTGEATNITMTSAMVQGNVTADGGATVTERGVCWSTSHTPTIDSEHKTNGSGIGSYTVSITGLTQYTKYYVRAYAINSEGISYGNEVEFTTLADKPTVMTNNVTNITENGAVCGGVVTDDGGATVTERGICWSTSTNPTISDQHTTNGTGIGSFVSTLSGLYYNTTYYVRAYATNIAGTSYGEQKTFVTAKAGWLFYDNGVYVNAWGLTYGGTYVWAVMFPSTSLTQYTGTSVTKVTFYVNDSGLGTYNLKIYRGGTSAPNTLIHTQDVAATSAGWKEVTISPLALETTQPLWIVLSIDQQANQYPASQSAGVNNPNARWGCWDGDWHDFGSETDFTWMIHTYVTSATKGEEIELH